MLSETQNISHLQLSSAPHPVSHPVFQANSEQFKAFFLCLFKLFHPCLFFLSRFVSLCSPSGSPQHFHFKISLIFWNTCYLSIYKLDKSPRWQIHALHRSPLIFAVVSELSWFCISVCLRRELLWFSCFVLFYAK